MKALKCIAAAVIIMITITTMALAQGNICIDNYNSKPDSSDMLEFEILEEEFLLPKMKAAELDGIENLAKVPPTKTSLANIWKSNGPNGGYVNNVSFSVSVPDIVYAATASGVYRSANNGETWSYAGLSGISVNVVSIDPSDADIVYAGVGKISGYVMDPNDGFYKSIDGGVSWTRKFHTWVTSIAIDPSNSNTIFVGTKTGHIYKSVNGGESKILVHNEYILSNGVGINSILVDPENSSIIYAGTGIPNYVWMGDRGFLKSIDGGQTWKGLNIGYSGPDKGLSLVCTPPGHEPQTLYLISSGDDGYGDIIFVSKDKGETWAGLFVPVFDEYKSARTLAIDNQNPDWLISGTNNPDFPLIAINYSDLLWVDISEGFPEPDPSCIAISPFNPIMLAGFRHGSLFRQVNYYGENWSACYGINNSVINDIEISPTNSSNALVAIEGKLSLQKTMDNGDSWAGLSPEFIRNFTSVSINPEIQSRIIAGTCGGNQKGSIYQSFNGGTSWIEEDRNNYSGRVKDLWIHPSNTNIILALKEHRTSYAGGVRRSINGGNSWNQAFNWNWPNCLASDPVNPDIVYMGTERLGYVFRSTDAGMSWNNISPGQHWVYNVYDIVLDSNSDVFAATSDLDDNETGGVWKLDEYGWSHLYRFGDTKVTALAIDQRTTPGTLYAGTSDAGVFKSEDGGLSWNPFNDGIGILNIAKLKLSKSPPMILYAGTNGGGVWSIPISVSHIITAVHGPNGKINPVGEVIVEHGSTLDFHIIHDIGYHVSEILIDDTLVNLGSDGRWNAEEGIFTFINVSKSHYIEALFGLNTYMIDATPNNINFGSVIGAGTYSHFEPVELRAIPSSGYLFVNWTENGLGVYYGDKYVFTATCNRNLVANFQDITSAESINDKEIVKIYPVPAEDFIVVNSNSIIRIICLIDISGYKYYCKTVNDNVIEFNIQDKECGMFLLKVFTDTGISIHRIIKIK